jgi:hypothetical protein
VVLTDFVVAIMGREQIMHIARSHFFRTDVHWDVFYFAACVYQSGLQRFALVAS